VVEQEQDWLVERFEEHRPRLRAVAYWMLGLREAAVHGRAVPCPRRQDRRDGLYRRRRAPGPDRADAPRRL